MSSKITGPVCRITFILHNSSRQKISDYVIARHRTHLLERNLCASVTAIGKHAARYGTGPRLLIAEALRAIHEIGFKSDTARSHLDHLVAAGVLVRHDKDQTLELVEFSGRMGNAAIRPLPRSDKWWDARNAARNAQRREARKPRVRPAPPNDQIGSGDRVKSTATRVFSNRATLSFLLPSAVVLGVFGGRVRPQNAEVRAKAMACAIPSDAGVLIGLDGIHARVRKHVGRARVAALTTPMTELWQDEAFVPERFCGRKRPSKAPVRGLTDADIDAALDPVPCPASAESVEQPQGTQHEAVAVPGLDPGIAASIARMRARARAEEAAGAPPMPAPAPVAKPPPERPQGTPTPIFREPAPRPPPGPPATRREIVRLLEVRGGLEGLVVHSVLSLGMPVGIFGQALSTTYDAMQAQHVKNPPGYLVGTMKKLNAGWSNTS